MQQDFDGIAIVDDICGSSKRSARRLHSAFKARYAPSDRRFQIVAPGFEIDEFETPFAITNGVPLERRQVRATVRSRVGRDLHALFHVWSHREQKNGRARSILNV